LPKLFGVDIAAELNKAMGSGMFPAVLHKVAAGTRTAGQLTGGNNPAQTNFAARGIVYDYHNKEIDGTNVLRSDRKVLLLGDTIAGKQVPEVKDRITIEGATHEIVDVDRDPAWATYICQVR